MLLGITLNKKRNIYFSHQYVFGNKYVCCNIYMVSFAMTFIVVKTYFIFKLTNVIAKALKFQYNTCILKSNNRK